MVNCQLFLIMNALGDKINVRGVNIISLSNFSKLINCHSDNLVVYLSITLFFTIL